MKEAEKQRKYTWLDRSVNFVQVAQVQQRINNFIEILANNQRQNVARGIDEEILPF